jgi:hypothetical protein
MNKTLCLVNGIAPEKIRLGLEYAEKHLPQEAPKLSVYVQYMQHSLLDQTVGQILEQFWKKPVPLESALTALPENLLHRRGRTVIIQSFLKEHVFIIMRGIKSSCPRPNDIIFAMVTETALGWKLDDYLVHLKEEHNYMKLHPPEQ